MLLWRGRHAVVVVAIAVGNPGRRVVIVVVIVVVAIELSVVVRRSFHGKRIDCFPNQSVGRSIASFQPISIRNTSIN